MATKPVSKKSMPCNKPKRTPSHPKKSHVVKACYDGKEKVIRFGQQGKKVRDAFWNCWKAQERRIAKNRNTKRESIVQSASRKKHRQGEVLGGVLGGQGQVEQGRQGEVMDDKDFVDVNRELATHGADLKHLRRDVDRILEKLENVAVDISGMKKSLNQSEGGWIFMLKVAAIAGGVVAVAKFLGA